MESNPVSARMRFRRAAHCGTESTADSIDFLKIMIFYLKTVSRGGEGGNSSGNDIHDSFNHPFGFCPPSAHQFFHVPTEKFVSLNFKRLFRIACARSSLMFVIKEDLTGVVIFVDMS
eukprot:Gb_18740 [translate_table: standard]